MARQFSGMKHVAMEWAYTAAGTTPDPFNDMDLDVRITGPDGREWLVPAFWAGGNQWRVRFAPPQAGTYQCRSECTRTSEAGLHGQECSLQVEPYQGDNPLLQHGPLRVSANRRHFEHEDGTPFFWLGDTWWMSLCQRIAWPDEFQALAMDRVQKGYSVIQIIAGLYPDMPPFDPRGANEAGYPWTQDYARINPAYFDMADLRLSHLVRVGLVPCLVGCWGYFLPIMGVEKMKKHWRYLLARYAAYPMVWCLAGEGAMPYYLSKSPERDAQIQIEGWTQVARYVRQTDPAGHLITVHPTNSARNQVSDDTLLDFDMLQTGHGSHEAIPNTVEKIELAVAKQPHMPVLNGEVCYEGILGRSREEIQRFMFWACVLRGACGHTYGANGIWQLNREELPFGASPHGGTWGNTPWTQASRLPGGRQVAMSKRFLERYPWHQLQPVLENEAGVARKPMDFCSAEIPGKLRITYLPAPIWPGAGGPVMRQLEPGATYKALYFDPQSGLEYPLGQAQADAQGVWPLAPAPIMQDLVLVLQR